MKESVVFNASFDRTAWIVTIFSILLSITICTLLLFNGINGLQQSRVSGIYAIIIAGFEIGIMLFIWLLAPRKYVIKPTGVTICRLGPDVVIPVEDIRGVHVLLTNSIFSDAIRLVASGGCFGYFGKWSSRSMGRFDSYATRTDCVIVIDRKSGNPVVLSPDDAQEFAEQVNTMLQ